MINDLPRANLQTNNSSGKVIPKKFIVTPTKSLKAKKSTSERSVQKKTFNLKTRINAVVNTKSGLAKLSRLQYKLKLISKTCSIVLIFNNTRHAFFSFDDRKAMNIACNEYKSQNKQ
jgi:hypothetical protein